MPRFINFRYTHGTKPIRRLLEEALDAKLANLFIRTWVKERFSPDATEYILLIDCIKRQEISNKSSIEFYQHCEDEDVDDSIVGVRSLHDLERVYALREQKQLLLAERIRVIKETGNITYLAKYLGQKAINNRDQPKGAA
jgi:hypothetical protein